MEIQRRDQLVELLKHYNLKLIGVEIGVAGGAFSEELLKAGMDKLFSVDAWTHMEVVGDGGFPEEWHRKNYRNACNRLSRYGNKSIIIKQVSHEAASWFDDNSLSLIYHDGCHELYCVSRDLEVWYPKLVSGGIWATHDYQNEGYGVKEAVTNFTSQRNIPIYLIPENHVNNSGAWFRKP